MDKLNRSENNVLDQIANHLMKNSHTLKDIGLYHGKMGIALFFFHYARYTENSLYDDFAGELLDEVCNNLDTKLPIDFEDGFCGIGWAIEYLLRKEFLKGDSDEILGDIDNQIMERDLRRVSDKNIATGLAGIGYYIQSRLVSQCRSQETKPFDSVYLTDWEKSTIDKTACADVDILNKICSRSTLETNSFADNEMGLSGGLAGVALRFMRVLPDYAWEDRDPYSCSFKEMDRAVLYQWIHYLTQLLCNLRTETDSFIYLRNIEKIVLLLEVLTLTDLEKEEALLLDLHALEKIGIPIDLFTNSEPIILEKISEKQVSFVIPIRLDSPERERNLDLLLDLLSERDNTEIIVLEADTESKYSFKNPYNNLRYIFIEDHDVVFHRTKYLNRLLNETQTEIVGIWDSDVILPESQIIAAIEQIRNGESVMSFPYDGHFYMLPPTWSNAFKNKRSYSFLLACAYSGNCSLVHHSVGGAFFVRKTCYMQAGGENENFYGWGLEDLERYRRMKMRGYSISRTNGPLYHLYHPRKENSIYMSDLHEKKNLQVLCNTCTTKTSLKR